MRTSVSPLTGPLVPHHSVTGFSNYFSSSPLIPHGVQAGRLVRSSHLPPQNRQGVQFVDEKSFSYTNPGLLSPRFKETASHARVSSKKGGLFQNVLPTRSHQFFRQISLQSKKWDPFANVQQIDTFADRTVNIDGIGGAESTHGTLTSLQLTRKNFPNLRVTPQDVDLAEDANGSADLVKVSSIIRNLLRTPKTDLDGLTFSFSVSPTINGRELNTLKDWSDLMKLPITEDTVPQYQTQMLNLLSTTNPFLSTVISDFNELGKRAVVTISAGNGKFNAFALARNAIVVGSSTNPMFTRNGLVDVYADSNTPYGLEGGTSTAAPKMQRWLQQIGFTANLTRLKNAFTVLSLPDRLGLKRIATQNIRLLSTVSNVEPSVLRKRINSI